MTTKHKQYKKRRKDNHKQRKKLRESILGEDRDIESKGARKRYKQ